MKVKVFQFTRDNLSGGLDKISEESINKWLNENNSIQIVSINQSSQSVFYDSTMHIDLIITIFYKENTK